MSRGGYSANGTKAGQKAVKQPSPLIDTRVIYCGDNSEQLRKLPSACIDLIYIDPPFNSNRNYEVFWGETKEKRAFEDRHASTQAYIDFMRPRCVELERVLKKSGTFYYHCDWHASHYVKVMLDQIFGEYNFLNEIVWKRSAAHSDTKQGRKAYGNISDSIFVYSGGNDKDRVWNTKYLPYDESYVKEFYKYVEEGTGRRYRLDNLTAAKPGGDVSYEFHGTRPYKGRYWAYSKENMEKLLAEGRLYFPKSGGTPSYKRYLDEMPGVSVQNVWVDIPHIASKAAERLGYPTQKPLALLERIIEISSNENDIILDAFCGCGTALVAAQKLNRQWIGVDVSPTACRVMAKRLRHVCGLREDESYWRHGRGFVVRDLPWSEKQLRMIPPFEFENWAVIALGGIPNKTQVGDMGIDGRIYPVGTEPKESDKNMPELNFMDDWYPIQVKQMDKIGRPDIDSFEAAMLRSKRKKGFFVGFDFSRDALTEIDGFFRREHAVIVPLTVRDILDETIARKLV
jgi:DNA modification methylase